ncbi:MAG: purine-nucleoside phosphorylase, partial [Clostridiales bacterium]|nr:purine-nucleoside phosphorylase [Clostridiales bacterium]
SNIYDPELNSAVRRAADAIGLSLKEGTYIQFTGPAYESPAEIRMAKAMGADAVGMSTACEAVAAVHMGLRVCGISCISNMAAGISKHPLSHAEVQASADRVGPVFRKLIEESITEISKII